MATTRKTSTKTAQSAETTTPKVETKAPAKKAAAKAAVGEQLTLVDALPVAVEPPAAAAPAPKKSELKKTAPAPAPAPRATRAAAPQVPEAQAAALVDAKPRRAGNCGEKQRRFDKGEENKHKRY